MLLMSLSSFSQNTIVWGGLWLAGQAPCWPLIGRCQGSGLATFWARSRSRHRAESLWFPEPEIEAGTRDRGEEGHCQWGGGWGHHIISDQGKYIPAAFFLCLYCSICLLQTIAWFQAVDVVDQITLCRKLESLDLRYLSFLESLLPKYSKTRSENLLTMLQFNEVLNMTENVKSEIHE